MTSLRLGDATRTRSRRQALVRALATMSYEILPFKSTEDAVLAHVPSTVPLTVTTTESKGLEPTLALAERLAGHGYSAAPHLAARLVRDDQQLTDIVARLAAAGTDSVFVIGGDAAEPAGRFADALSLLEALERLGHPFAHVGIGGYPEGHGHISPELIERALRAKTRHATHVVTQLCFDADTTTNWARQIKRDGVELPIHVGLPGAVSRPKLIRISAGLGLGQSARFLKKQQSMFWRFFLPGGYRPNRLVERLAPRFADADNNLYAFHLFTFNELDKTEAWRRAVLAHAEESP